MNRSEPSRDPLKPSFILAPEAEAQTALFNNPWKLMAASNLIDRMTAQNWVISVAVAPHLSGLRNCDIHCFLGSTTTLSTAGLLTSSGAPAGSTNHVIRAPGMVFLMCTAAGMQ